MSRKFCRLRRDTTSRILNCTWPWMVQSATLGSALESHGMNRVRSGDAEIAYEVLGAGPPLVFLHPFPAHHELWLPAAQALTSRYRVILPDLRAHGESEAGEGPATMGKQ